ncbi:MAG: hypothetical protein U0610_25185 [bacterium]
MNARSLLGLIALEAALTVAVLLYTPPSLSRVAADDCDSVRDGLAVQIGTTLELELHHARTDPSVSPAVAAVRGAQQLWGIVPPSPNDSSQPAFAIVESTDFVPIKSRACTAYVLADPRPNATAVVIRQFARGQIAEIDVEPGQRLVPPA